MLQHKILEKAYDKNNLANSTLFYRLSSSPKLFPQGRSSKLVPRVAVEQRGKPSGS